MASPRLNITVAIGAVLALGLAAYEVTHQKPADTVASTTPKDAVTGWLEYGDGRLINCTVYGLFEPTHAQDITPVDAWAPESLKQTAKKIIPTRIDGDVETPSEDIKDGKLRFSAQIFSAPRQPILTQWKTNSGQTFETVTDRFSKYQETRIIKPNTSTAGDSQNIQILGKEGQAAARLCAKYANHFLNGEGQSPYQPIWLKSQSEEPKGPGIL